MSHTEKRGSRRQCRPRRTFVILGDRFSLHNFINPINPNTLTMAGEDDVMTDVEAFDDEEVKRFVLSRNFANPHSVVVNARDIAFTGSGEKLDGDMVPISVVSDDSVERSLGIKHSSSCTRNTYRTFWRKT